MISKRIQGEYKNKYGTKNAVEYIADKAIENMTNYAANKTEKAWYINLPQDKELAIAKMQNTQAMNTTTTSSKIYHYTVSFPDGEKPNDKIMLDIEKNISEALGYKDYQRVIAIHDDTGHYHMHIVVNTIHPTKYINRNSPSNDYYIRNDVMRVLEKKHNLTVDNGIEQKSQRQENKNHKAIDFEAHTGLESFTTYLKKEIKENALNANNWQELHKLAKKVGVIAKLQGNGLVFKSINSKVTVKASTVDRKLSKSNLEQKLGIFTEFQQTKNTKTSLEAQNYKKVDQGIQTYNINQNNAIKSIIEQEKNYTPKPIHKNADNLWQRYLEDKKSTFEARKNKKATLNKVFDLQNTVIKEIWGNRDLAYSEKQQLHHQLNIITIKNKYNLYAQNLDNDAKQIYEKAQDKFIKLEILKYDNLQNIQNKFLPRQEKQELVNKVNEIYIKAILDLRNEIKKEYMQNKHNSLSWVDFLRKEVKSNNPQALKVLRSIERKEQQNSKPCIIGVKINSIILANAKIGKNGTISYETKDGGLFIDAQNKITVVKDSPQAQEQAYSLAKQQFQHTMKVKGNLEHWNKQQIQKGLER
ncbi:MAG: hypothetical protein RLZZ210_1769 [Pseudomonadota bacterium]|jgi:hypothetical protein